LLVLLFFEGKSVIGNLIRHFQFQERVLIIRLLLAFIGGLAIPTVSDMIMTKDCFFLRITQELLFVL
jgi:hypothetical protein